MPAVAPAAKPSGRMPAVPAPKPSGRMNAVAAPAARPSGRLGKKPASPPPEEPAEDVVVSDEPLFEDGDVPMAKNKGVIKTDDNLIAEDTLYSDDEDDPKERLKQIQRKQASQKMDAAKSNSARKAVVKVEEEAPKKSGWGDELEAEQEAEGAAEEDVDEEQQEEEAPRKGARGSQRMTVAKPGSTRAKAEDDTRRSGRKSIRSSSSGPAKPFLTTKVKIILGVSAFLILLLVFGYDPAMRAWQTKKLDEGASVEERKAAAEALFDRYNDAAWGIYSTRVNTGNPDLREAAVFGLELVAKHGSRSKSAAVETLTKELGTADAAGKLVLIKSLGSVAKALQEAKGNDEDVARIAKSLIPATEMADLKPEGRQMAVDALSTLPVPGVCKQLIKIAKTEKGEMRAKARDGIARTALPDAAGDLLETMTGDDKELATDAKRSFGRIRTETKSELLLPLVTHQRDDVRREIVEALGMRANDAKAAQGVTTALKDKVPEIRELAVRAIPKTGISGLMTQLSDLVVDPEEKVRIANAESLAQLRDPESQKVILKAFENDLQGKTMDAYITALGKRSSGKDLKSIGMLLGILESKPTSEPTIKPALVLLANHKTNRTNWTVEQWKAWFAKINQRDQMRTAALAVMEADRGKSSADRSLYAKIAKEIEENLDVLEKCKEMSKPDDMEDIASFDQDLTKYTKVREFFFKGASVDVRN
jgi:hypothetical protein